MSWEGSNRKSPQQVSRPMAEKTSPFLDIFGRSYDFWAVGKCRAQVDGNQLLQIEVESLKRVNFH